MIYVLESGDYYKIGYTTNWIAREKDYKTHNPNFKLLYLKEGNSITEKELHKQFEHLRINGEWFKKDRSILSAMSRLEVMCNNDYIQKLKDQNEILVSFIENNYSGNQLEQLNFDLGEHIFKCIIKELG